MPFEAVLRHSWTYHYSSQSGGGKGLAVDAFNTSAAWFVAAVAIDNALSRSKLFAPGSSIRIGRADSNDFVIATCAVESHLALADGTDVRLLAGFEARMAGVGVPLIRSTLETDGPTVRVITDCVGVTLWPGHSLFVRWFVTREEADAFIDEQLSRPGA